MYIPRDKHVWQSSLCAVNTVEGWLIGLWAETTQEDGLVCLQTSMSTVW